MDKPSIPAGTGAAILGLVVVGALLLTMSFMASQGNTVTYDTRTTPSASCLTTVSNNVTTLEVNGISGPVVLCTDLTIYVRAPDFRLTSWNLSQAGWVGDTASYFSDALNCRITVSITHPDLVWPFFDVGDVVTVEAMQGFGAGTWTVAIFYNPTGGLVYQTSFSAP